MEFTWPGSTPDLALHGVGREWWITRSRRVGGVRWVETFEAEGGRMIVRERVRWEVDETRFAETGRWVGDGPNLHRRATVLPARMRVGESALPLPGARITLAWVGVAELRCGPHAARHRCARLLVEQGGMRVEQWLAEGVGELAVGAADGPFGRWLVGWRGGERHLLFDPGEIELPAADLEDDGAPDVGPRA